MPMPSFVQPKSFGHLLLSGALVCNLLPAQNPSEKPLYKNPSQPLAERVDDLIAKMTLEEKVSQLGHTADAILRLGIPEYNWWNEGLHGVARGAETQFAITSDATLPD